MTSMIEKAARASYYALITGAADLRPGAPFKKWEDLPEEHRNLQRIATRAAILAIRDPNEAMERAEFLEFRKVQDGFHSGTCPIFQAVIDAILKETPQ